MNKFEIIIPTLFGIESIVAHEVRKLGYETTSVEDGRVTFMGDYEAICRANIWIRSGERVLIKVGEFEAVTFDELFEKTKVLPWGEWLPKDCAFPVKGYSLKSALHSVPDCQAIIKKSIVNSMTKKYHLNWFEERGVTYQIQFSIMKDRVTLMIDTSGEGLHKRGYREKANAAPLRETLAAAMIDISRWHPDRTFCDPFCGSGTIVIEAAMIGKNIAPGLNRQFAAEKFSQIPKSMWWETRKDAHSRIRDDVELNIYASDIDHDAVALTKANCEIAGVDEYIKISTLPIKELNLTENNGVLICNPPYGERMGEKQQVEGLYREMGKVFPRLDNWAYYIITSNEMFEGLFGRRADKKRKLYNGMMRCNYYQYFNKKIKNYE